MEEILPEDYGQATLTPESGTLSLVLSEQHRQIGVNKIGHFQDSSRVLNLAMTSWSKVQLLCQLSCHAPIIQIQCQGEAGITTIVGQGGTTVFISLYLSHFMAGVLTVITHHLMDVT